MYKAARVTFMTIRESTSKTMKLPRDFADYCKDLEDMSQESFHVLLLNQKNKIMDRVMVSLGTLTSAIIHPREVFRPAVIAGAAAVCLIHNHPSGDPAPSEDDRKMTKRLKEASDILGIRILDHIIVGRDGFFSFEQDGQQF